MLVVLGAAAGLPFMFYLFGTPRFWPFAASAVPMHLAAAAALWQRLGPVAWLLFIPTPLLTGYVGAVVAGYL